MCGIVGVFDGAGSVSRETLERMNTRLKHRGPDGEGYFHRDNFSMAHTRLAIIDPTPAGQQPMRSTDGRYTLCYNGEIYNFRELRAELTEKGYEFHSRCDTEVLLYAFAEWKEAALSRLNGMFAFAVWDELSKELFLARDRYGIKPLYYHQRGELFSFASEVKALLAHPDIRATLDRAALVEYFTFQNHFSERTLFDGIQLFPAGTFMRIRAGRIQEKTKYWDYSFEEPESPLDERDYIEEVHRLFTQAVNRQLVSDVGISSYLSGGLDTGAITAVASKSISDLKSFTIGFDLHSASGMELLFDEREQAEHMSYLFQTEHYQMVLKAGDMVRSLPAMAWHLEEPRVGQSYPNYYAAKLASQFGKVVLSGTGGDELFGGYPWRYYRAVVNKNFEDYVDKYYSFWQRLLREDEAKDVFKPLSADAEVNTRELFYSVFPPHARRLTRPEDYVNYSLYFEARTFLHGLLVVEDKLSMAHGLETRVPFLDNDLVDFAMRIPVRLKLGNLAEIVRLDENEHGPKSERYFAKTNDGKLILRKALSRYVPADIAHRRKQGFSAPDASWFRGESLEYVRSRIDDDRSPLYEFLDRRAVRKLVDEHMSGRKNRRLFIWSLLSFEKWCQTFLN